MKIIYQLSTVFLLFASIQTWAADRVYTANQNSNTVSVIDPAVDKVVATITLGKPAADRGILSPLYKGQINVHGLNFSVPRKELAVVSTVSNGVTIINTTNNKVKGTVYVGRNPHEPRYTPDGKELWVTVRGENYISVISPDEFKEIKRIKLIDGPGMIDFSRDGKKAYVCSSFNDEFTVIDAKKHTVIKTTKVASPFCPFTNLNNAGDEVFITHKDIGKVSRIDAKSGDVIEVFDTGKITNHVGFAGNYLFVTIGGEDVVKVFTKKDNNYRLVNTIQTGDLPHGIWGDSDGKKMYIGNELDGTVSVIDVEKMKVINTIKVGLLPQALVYMPDAL